MISTRLKLSMIAAAVAPVALAGMAAQATPVAGTLELQIGLVGSANPAVSVIDNATGDANAAAGIITVNGLPVGDYSISGSASSSKGQIGSQAMINDNTVSVRNTTSTTETLDILVSDFGFTGVQGAPLVFSSASATYTNTKGDTTPATVTFLSGVNPNNTPILWNVTPTVSTSKLSGSLSSGTVQLTNGSQNMVSAPFTLSGAFAMADLAQIVLPSGGQLTFDGTTFANVQNTTPEPASIALLGAAGLPLLISRKRKGISA
ncbi:MAG: PEP-CTERM sorting domain-containing protein [Phycisphaerales bacterium]|nr:PEP-CTERM sorting domain-containing protein [Phycisphaerales bacterium]